MILIIKKRQFEVADFAAASAKYDCERSASGQGMRTFPEGKIMADGQMIARVSYNAKVWPDKAWHMGDVPLFNPYA